MRPTAPSSAAGPCRQVGTNQPLDALLAGLNPAARGWCAYFRPGVSAATFSYLRHYLWHTVWGWVQRKHPKTARRKILPPPLRRPAGDVVFGAEAEALLGVKNKVGELQPLVLLWLAVAGASHVMTLVVLRLRKRSSQRLMLLRRADCGV